MRVFLDIGAADGRITGLALATGAFDVAFCFEPQVVQCDRIRALADPRIQVCPFALAHTTGETTLYRGQKLDTASLYADKIFRGSVRVQPCQTVCASDWFDQHLTQDDYVIAKMNCEGAECDIVENLAASGELRKLRGLALIFDIRKVPSQRHREATVRALLTQVPKVFIMEEWDCGYPDRWLPAIL